MAVKPVGRVRCYWLEPTDRRRVSLRRAHFAQPPVVCAQPSAKYTKAHHAVMQLGEEVAAFDPEQPGRRILSVVNVPADDARWPTRCAGCGFEFGAEDFRTVDQYLIYRRADTGALLTLHEAGPGAMWDASWYPDEWKGKDGRCLVVRLPDMHDWVVDSRASNCTMPEDNVHKCWVRTGTPPDIDVTKGKKGESCKAGGGSILTKKYHGHLRNGWLVSC